LDKIVKVLAKKDRCLSEHVGTRYYRAPEVVLMQKQYDQAQDVWSLGCVFFEMM
jgi:mitogen-activated protein kinase 1/3